MANIRAAGTAKVRAAAAAPVPRPLLRRSLPAGRRKGRQGGRGSEVGTGGTRHKVRRQPARSQLARRQLHGRQQQLAAPPVGEPFPCQPRLTVHDVHAQSGGGQAHQAELQALAGVALQAVLVSRAL